MPQPAGRGGGTVIHASWNAEGRGPAGSVLLDRCTLTRGGTASALDRVTGAVVGGVRQVLGTDVPCRVEVHQDQGPSEVMSGEQQLTTRAFKVQVPWDRTDVKVGDLVEVTDSGDPGLVGRLFRVLSVAATSLHWTRVLRCEADEG